MKEKIVVDGITYVPEGSQTPAVKVKGLEYCIVRTYSAGVFAGYVKSRKGQEATVIKARRLWYWDGSASLSELAVKGVGKPENCKFPCEVDKVELMQVIEIIQCSEVAKKSIASVPEWTAQ